MRSICRMAGVAVLCALAFGCDTSQPLQIDEQTFELSFSAPGAQLARFNVYDGFEDSDGDMMPDDVDGDGQPDFFLFCRTATGPAANPSSIPFGYTLQITILRADSTTPEQINSSTSLVLEEKNLTDYDMNPPELTGVPPQSPIPIGQRTFRFENPRRLSAANRAVMMATTNPVSTADPGTYGAVGSGRCSSNDPGPSAIDLDSTLPYPLSITLNKGDTLTVKARRGTGPPAGLTVLNAPAPGLSASLTLNGRPVATRGTQSAALGPAEGLAFSFTSR